MPTTGKPDAKIAELNHSGTLNPNPEGVVDPLFRNNPFFDGRDLLQARYEMLRRHRVEGLSIVEAALAFGVSRPTFYQAQTAFAAHGMAGLLPQQRGPKGRHKLSPEILLHVEALKTAVPPPSTEKCIKEIHQRFGILVHRRSLERALQGKKNTITRHDRLNS